MSTASAAALACLPPSRRREYNTVLNSRHSSPTFLRFILQHAEQHAQLHIASNASHARRKRTTTSLQLRWPVRCWPLGTSTSAESECSPSPESITDACRYRPHAPSLKRRIPHRCSTAATAAAWFAARERRSRRTVQTTLTADPHVRLLPWPRHGRKRRRIRRIFRTWSPVGV
jgi:hypothetical protein